MAKCCTSDNSDGKNNNTTVSPTKETSITAYRSLRAHLCFWSVMAVGLIADLATKLWAVQKLGATAAEPSREIVIVERYLRLNLVFNEGAVAGLAAGKTALLIAASIVAVFFVIWLFATSGRRQWVTHISLGMLLAGAMGNLYDRIFNQGRVIDFIEVNLHFPPADPWPTFNIADILLCFGVAVLVLCLLVRPKTAK